MGAKAGDTVFISGGTGSVGARAIPLAKGLGLVVATKAVTPVTSSLAADVAALQDDVAGIDGNLSVATSTVYVQETVTEAIDDLDELADLDF